VTFRNSAHGKLDLSQQVVFGTHRSGWQFALEHIKDLHNTEGTLFDGFLERRFGWHLCESVERGIIPYVRPWVGVFHNPPNMPEFWNYASSPRGLLDNYYFKESLKSCVGIFVLSDYLARWLACRIDVPIVSLKHPIDLSVPCFSYQAFLESPEKRIVQAGFWLRKFQSLKHLPVEGFKKKCIVPHKYADEYRRLEQKYVSRYNENGEEILGEYEEMEWLPPREYDRLLQSSVVYLDLYDASANNAILECIARNTPLLVNPLPAVVEYLGPNYPMYFETLEEAAQKALSERCVLEANEYLASMDKSVFSTERFRVDIIKSGIYRSLPSPTGMRMLAADQKPPIDTVADINMVQGQPLSNEYIFVVCFRNVGRKLKRCIESICNQKRCHDYGVILIDDASNDGAVYDALSLLEQHALPQVIVVNDERKYFTRNLYNAVNLLIDNDESVVVEIDGDDYLEDTDVLGILSEAYELGAIKTFGSFRCIAEDDDAADAVESYRLMEKVNDMSRPWDLDACISWIHLKTYRKNLFMKVPLVYFWEKTGANWLKMAEDMAIHPKMVEIARYRTAYIADVLYVYDISGEQHDIVDANRADYLVKSLYKLPYGTFIHQCRQQLRESQKQLAQIPDIPPAVEKVAGQR